MIMIDKIKRIFRFRGASNPQLNAFSHNSLDNVNNKNSDITNWKANYENDSKFINQIYKDIIYICQISNNCSVLDVGCGTGVLVSKIRHDFPNAYCFGTDFSSSKVEQCKKFCELDCFYVKSIYEPFNNNFDVIIATEVLEHLEKPENAIVNLLKHLASNGRLLLTVPDGRKDTFFGHIHFWSPESWQIFIQNIINKESFKFDIGMLHNNNYALIKRV